VSVLSPGQIAAAAASAGIPKDRIAVAVAIALAESGGNTNAYNGQGRDDSYGLWQINMKDALGPVRRQQFGIGSNQELFNPSVNARAMALISSQGKNWTPWTTYTRGTYLRFLSQGNEAAKGVGSLPSLPDVPNPLGDLSAIKKAVDTLTNETTWIRAGLFLSGMVLILIGFVKLTGDNQLSPVTKKVVKAVVMRKVTK
jgi:lysozyme-like protein